MTNFSLHLIAWLFSELKAAPNALYTLYVYTPFTIFHLSELNNSVRLKRLNLLTEYFQLQSL